MSAAAVRPLAVTLAAALAFTSPARAAFEVRDGSPAALGAASLDLESVPFFEPAGFAASASHTTLYQS
ncbi:MAG TPA: hypothetical protein VFR25_02875, partial [Candidatus Eisenbacteria bacterium]|nr:hypothetical protein [Candidatus Eisenbacteria bacterium]